MLNTDISKELRSKIEMNQGQLKDAIRKHQKLMARLKESDIRFIKQVQDLIDEAQQQIIIIGLEQKGLVEKLRKEYKIFQRNYKTNVIKNGIEERRVNLATSFNRARKQNIIVRATAVQSVPSVSPSEGSEIISTPTTPEPITFNPLNPQDISQTEFLTYFGLATHDVFKEIQNKRAERKRRRTANPQFLYTRGWDISKRKRNMYLASNVSPPNTRQSTKNRRGGSPSFKSRPSSPVESKKGGNYSQNWPSGLTIERVKSTEDQLCSECNKPDNLLHCDACSCAFHVTCHNRPLSQTPKHCPKCLKTVLANEAELNEKLEQRSQLVEKNKELNGDLTKLHDRHAELVVILKTADDAKKEQLSAQQIVENKINTLLKFVTRIQEFVIPTEDPTPVIIEDDTTSDSVECIEIIEPKAEPVEVESIDLRLEA